MKTTECILVTLAAAVLLAPAAALSAEAAPLRPNIVFILTDDMGWGDLSCYGGKEVKTTNIDRLASEGLRFTQFYSASPICSPSRVAFTTGMYPARWRINSYLQSRAGNRATEQADWLDPKAPSLARTFKAAGYATGHFGKWHMGGGRDVDDAPLPPAYGFDESWSTWEGLGPGIDSGPAAKNTPRFRRTEKFVDKTIAFIKQHRQEPFYVNLWPNDVHTPHVADPELLPKYAALPGRRQAFAGVLDEYDRQVGRVLACLKELGLERNTIVVFSSDNGPEPSFNHQRSGGLRGQKWSLYEGGIREPLIVRWPDKVPAGKVNEKTVITAMDLFPTLCSLAGVPLLGNFSFDGEDMSTAWLGQSPERKTPLYWEYGRRPKVYLYPPAEDRSPNVAVRDGDWKLLLNADGTGAELFDLATDRNEVKNLAADRPAEVKRLSAAALQWRKALP